MHRAHRSTEMNAIPFIINKYETRQTPELETTIVQMDVRFGVILVCKLAPHISVILSQVFLSECLVLLFEEAL